MISRETCEVVWYYELCLLVTAIIIYEYDMCFGRMGRFSVGHFFALFSCLAKESLVECKVTCTVQIPILILRPTVSHCGCKLIRTYSSTDSKSERQLQSALTPFVQRSSVCLTNPGSRQRVVVVFAMLFCLYILRGGPALYDKRIPTYPLESPPSHL